MEDAHESLSLVYPQFGRWKELTPALQNATKQNTMLISHPLHNMQPAFSIPPRFRAKRQRALIEVKFYNIWREKFDYGAESMGASD